MNRPTRELTLEAMTEVEYSSFTTKLMSRVRKGEGPLFPLEETMDGFVQRKIMIYEVLERFAYLAFAEGRKSRQHEIDTLKEKGVKRKAKP